jgi:hypothetical protein
MLITNLMSRYSYPLTQTTSKNQLHVYRALKKEAAILYLLFCPHSLSPTMEWIQFNSISYITIVNLWPGAKINWSCKLRSHHSTAHTNHDEMSKHFVD